MSCISQQLKKELNTDGKQADNESINITAVYFQKRI